MLLPETKRRQRWQRWNDSVEYALHVTHNREHRTHTHSLTVTACRAKNIKKILDVNPIILCIAFYATLIVLFLFFPFSDMVYFHCIWYVSSNTFWSPSFWVLSHLCANVNVLSRVYTLVAHKYTVVVKSECTSIAVSEWKHLLFFFVFILLFIAWRLRRKQENQLEKKIRWWWENYGFFCMGV